MDSSFSMRVDLSDHTGTVTGAYLQGEVATKMLNCSVCYLMIIVAIELFFFVPEKLENFFRNNFKYILLTESIKDSAFCLQFQEQS